MATPAPPSCSPDWRRTCVLGQLLLWPSGRCFSESATSPSIRVHFCCEAWEVLIKHNLPQLRARMLHTQRNLWELHFSVYWLRTSFLIKVLLCATKALLSPFLIFVPLRLRVWPNLLRPVKCSSCCGAQAVLSLFADAKTVLQFGEPLLSLRKNHAHRFHLGIFTNCYIFTSNGHELCSCCSEVLWVNFLYCVLQFYWVFFLAFLVLLFQRMFIRLSL